MPGLEGPDTEYCEYLIQKMVSACKLNKHYFIFFNKNHKILLKLDWSMIFISSYKFTCLSLVGKDFPSYIQTQSREYHFPV